MRVRLATARRLLSGTAPGAGAMASGSVLADGDRRASKDLRTSSAPPTWVPLRRKSIARKGTTVSPSQRAPADLARSRRAKAKCGVRQRTAGRGALPLFSTA